MKSCLHFVGFHDDAYTRAVFLFGRPDFVHRQWDWRAAGDVAPDDVIVFARTQDFRRWETGQPYPNSFNDSEQF